MELKKDELLKKVDEEFQWPLVTVGSVGAAGLVATTLFVCYSKLR
ncbi:unnamed protein product [Arabidopsis arenosa]|uniref:Uncharacterized protein n=1 Tax=Arabidopsis arenosa TaxID=38785 RepID=A0A8S2AF04_ARAAE|nr:unnamed protein product [Arabidopsis arenosa]